MAPNPTQGNNPTYANGTNQSQPVPRHFHRHSLLDSAHRSCGWTLASGQTPLTPQVEAGAAPALQNRMPATRRRSLQALGIFCGFAAGAWLGGAEAPIKLVNPDIS